MTSIPQCGSALMDASAAGQCEIVKMLLAHRDIDVNVEKVRFVYCMYALAIISSSFCYGVLFLGWMLRSVASNIKWSHQNSEDASCSSRH